MAMRMDRASEQLKAAFDSFVDASKVQLTTLTQQLHELNQKCADLTQSSAQLMQENAEQEGKLDSFIREQEEAYRRLENAERKLDKHESAIDEQQQSISQLESEYTISRSRFVDPSVITTLPERLLPSHEATSDSQEFFSCVELSSPRSSTFAGDDVAGIQQSNEWQSLATGTPVSLGAFQNIPRSQVKRKRNVTFSDTFDSTGIFRVPQIPTRRGKSHKTRTRTIEPAQMDNLTTATPAKPANLRVPKVGSYPTLERDDSESVETLRAETPIKDYVNEYDSENIIVAHRFGRNAKATPTPPASIAETESVDNQLHGSNDVPQEQGIDELMPDDEMQAAYSNLIQQFHTRTGEMQAATSSEQTDSAGPAEAIAFCRVKGGRLRNNPRKSTWLIRQERDCDD